VTPQAFSAALAGHPGAVLLDVRTTREWNEGHLTGAKRWDYFDTAFRDSLATVPVGGPVFVYCAAGGRSGEAATVLKELGHREVYNLAGGFDAWERAGLPFEKP
jgi:rhodanese-related sulfurtransferase